MNGCEKNLSWDFEYICSQAKLPWEMLRGQRIFITGGTGFFGCWLLNSLIWANKILNLNVTAVVLTRNVAQFSKKCPHLFLESSLVFQEGDVRSFEFPSGHFSYVIHAATDACVTLNKNQPDMMFDTIVTGTKRVLEFSKQCGVQSTLLTSSGAVYGKQPSDLSHIPENYLENKVQLESDSAYVKGKRRAEELCGEYASLYHLDIKIARCFAFVGPYLPLDTHFAIGNFIRDGLMGQPIIVKSDGSAFRSYLYAADLTIWLWTILLQGKTMRPYNVGSDQACTIRELAQLVAKHFDRKIEVHIEQVATNLSSERYIPDISRARDELGLELGIDLTQAIAATVNWYT